MPAVRTEKLPRSDTAILADPSNAKLFGKRCTALIDAGEYADALLDAKTLVRILPDAPIGYLKASRCYRLLKKLKAAQKMLDMAVERAEDEGTVRAVRTEQRKIDEDSEKLARDRSKPFANELPEEIFLHVASHLSQFDLIRTAQVNQTWRTVLHGHPHLWTTMYLHVSEQQGKRLTPQHLQQFDNQIRFYEERLPEEGQRLLDNLSLHVQLPPSDTFTLPKTRLKAIYDGQHRFCQNLCRLSISGKEAGEWARQLYDKWSVEKPIQQLRCLRYAVDEQSTIQPARSMSYLRRFPNLLTFESLFDSNISAENDPHWLLQEINRPKTGAEDPPTAAVQRLTLHGPMHLVEYTEQPLEENFENLQHLDIGSRNNRAAFSCFFTNHPLEHLRTLCLNNTLFNANFTHPWNGSTSEATELARVESFLVPPLDFPCLESLKIVYTDTRGFGNAVAPRYRLRPSVYLCRLKAQKLRHLTINNLGAIHATSPSVHIREQGAWMKFCEAHPQLEELVLSKTTIVDLVESLQYLPNIRKLLLNSVDLPSTFLKSATSPSLPLLQQLTISHCSNISSGDLVRLINSKNGNLNYLDIEACTQLQKEAVDWIKNNVRQVKWSGWRDKHEKRSFTYRS